jgi:hypothetical protein
MAHTQGKVESFEHKRGGNDGDFQKRGGQVKDPKASAPPRPADKLPKPPPAPKK